MAKQQTESALARIHAIREQIAHLKSAAAKLGEMPVDEAAAIARLDMGLAELFDEPARRRLAEVAVDLRLLNSTVWRESLLNFLAAGTVGTLHRGVRPELVALLVRDVLRSTIITELKRAGAGITEADRASRLAENAAHLDQAERHEESMIRAFEAEGGSEDRRIDARPDLVLDYNPSTGFFDDERLAHLERDVANRRLVAEAARERARESRTELQRTEARHERIRREHEQHYEPSEMDLQELARAKRQLQLDTPAAAAAEERAARLAPLVSKLREAITRWRSEQDAKKPAKEHWIKSWIPKPAKEKQHPYFDVSVDRQTSVRDKLN